MNSPLAQDTDSNGPSNTNHKYLVICRDLSPKVEKGLARAHELVANMDMGSAPAKQPRSL